MSGTIKDADILFGKPTGDEISFFKFSRPPRVEGKFRKPRRQMTSCGIVHGLPPEGNTAYS